MIHALLLLTLLISPQFVQLGSGVTSLGHFDGDDTDKGLKGMIASVKHISKSKYSSGR